MSEGGLSPIRPSRSGLGVGTDVEWPEWDATAPPDADWSWRALRALRRFGDRTVPALVEALREAHDPSIRRFAAASLGRLAGEAREAAPDLRHAADHDADPEVRAAASTALAALAADQPA